MPIEDCHLSEQELLLAVDDELPAREALRVRVHLSACASCSAMMAEVKRTIGDFAHAHHGALDPTLPPIAGPRALLKVQLAELAAKSKVSSWRRFLEFTTESGKMLRAVGYACAVFSCIAVSILLLQHSPLPRAKSLAVSNEQSAVPDHNLTPGATRDVAVSEVCSMIHEEVIRDVPTSLRQQVLQEYGIKNARTKDYEIDYLIAPGLGGTEDVHNLWPEPYTSTVWNARVKDSLEERLHQMVCAGKLNLSTAQHDIATDWIGAYKKYFHTDKPLSLRATSILL
jgi:Putative zinc-finger